MIEEALNALIQLETEEPTGRSIALDQFLAALSELVASGDDEMRRSFADDTAARVLAKPLHVSYYLDRIENTLFDSEWYGNEWFSVRFRRSRFASFLEVYREPISDDYCQVWLDTEEVDHAIRVRSESEGPAQPDEIPAGTPTSHWWGGGGAPTSLRVEIAIEHLRMTTRWQTSGKHWTVAPG